LETDLTAPDVELYREYTSKFGIIDVSKFYAMLAIVKKEMKIDD